MHPGLTPIMMRSFVLATVLAIVAIASPTRPAWADYPWSFVQITCAPELGYFSIREIVIMNLPNKGPYLTEGLTPGRAVVTALNKKYGIFDSQVLKAHPFTCTIPDLDPVPGWEAGRSGFNVKVIGHLDEHSESSSYCQIADDAEAFVDGKSIGLFRLNPCGNGPQPRIIEIAHDGVELRIRKCFHADAPGQLTCSEEPLVAHSR